MSEEKRRLAVLTGCMRISKESIFIGLNNFITFTIADVDFDEYFGFTDQEVCDLLTYYECRDKYESIKEWYEGYRFGNVDVYCPWDVVSYLRSLRTNREAIPQNYWINTSSNAEVKESRDIFKTRLWNISKKVLQKTGIRWADFVRH